MRRPDTIKTKVGFPPGSKGAESEYGAAQNYLKETFEESLRAKQAFVDTYGEALVLAARKIAQSIQAGGKLMICGNGGSASDSQHMAAEMIGRMLIERRPLPVVSLAADMATMTALANDYGYETVFARQVEGIAKPGDVLFGISTSGRSENVVRAFEVARKKGAFTIALTGGSGGRLREVADLVLCVELGRNASRIQETHIFAVHSVVDMIDRFFS